MSRNQITLRITGTESNDSVRIRDFTKALNQFLDIARDYDKAMTGGSIDYYKIVGLTFNSPPTITQEAVPFRTSNSDPGEVHHSLLRDIEMIATGGELSEFFDFTLLSRLEDFVGSYKGRVTKIDIQYLETTVSLDSDFGASIDRVMGPKSTEYGEIYGSLDQINLHEKNKKLLNIYPAIGAKKIPCLITNDNIKEKAKQNLEKWVMVRGLLTYRERSNFPVFMEVNEIEPMPEPTRSLSSMFKEAPILGGFEKLDEVRNAWA